MDAIEGLGLPLLEALPAYLGNLVGGEGQTAHLVPIFFMSSNQQSLLDVVTSGLASVGGLIPEQFPACGVNFGSLWNIDEDSVAGGEFVGVREYEHGWVVVREQSNRVAVVCLVGDYCQS